jgi:hypothetical protein
LRGFPEGEKEQSEPETGLFYPWKSTILIGSREYLSDDVVAEGLEFSTLFRILEKRINLISYSIMPVAVVTNAAAERIFSLSFKTSSF